MPELWKPLQTGGWDAANSTKGRVQSGNDPLPQAAAGVCNTLALVPRLGWRGPVHAHLNAALACQLHSGVVVAAAQQVLHHHAVHALPLPHAGGRWLVAAVLLEVLDPPFAQLCALVLRLDRLYCLCRGQKARQHRALATMGQTSEGGGGVPGAGGQKQQRGAPPCPPSPPRGKSTPAPQSRTFLSSVVCCHQSLTARLLPLPGYLSHLLPFCSFLSLLILFSSTSSLFKMNTAPQTRSISALAGMAADRQVGDT